MDTEPSLRILLSKVAVVPMSRICMLYRMLTVEYGSWAWFLSCTLGVGERFPED